MTFNFHIQYANNIISRGFIFKYILIRLMGQQSLQNHSDLTFESQQWVEAVEDTHNSRFTNINIYRKRLLMNKLTSELIEEYELQFLSQEDFSSFLAYLQLRKQQKNNKKLTLANRAEAEMSSSPYIYKIRHFQNLSVKEMCSTVYNGLLYIDKVDLRLKQIKDIPFQDQLYLLQACLSGFKILYEKVGVFEINEEMIFFDEYGHVKVWMNPNLSSFQPNYQPQYYNNLEYNESQGSQTQMLKNLINIIEQNSDKQLAISNFLFKNYLISKGLFDRLSFSKAIEYFNLYCQQYRLQVNTYLKSIYDLFHYDQAGDRKSEAQVSQVGTVNFNGNFDIRGTESNRNTFEVRKVEREVPGAKLLRQQQYMNQMDKNCRLQSSIASEKGNGMNHFNQSRLSYEFNANKKPESSFKFHSESNKPNQRNVFSDKLSQFEQIHQSNRFFRIENVIEPRKIITFRPSQLDKNDRQGKMENLVPKAQIKTQQLGSLTRYKSLDKHMNLNGIHPKTNITFNYNATKQQGIIRNSFNKINEKQSIRKQSIIEALNSPSFNSINQMSDERNQLFIRGNELVSNNKYNYYSSHSEYILDKEIADDMMKYLGFNPNIS